MIETPELIISKHRSVLNDESTERKTKKIKIIRIFQNFKKGQCQRYFCYDHIILKNHKTIKIRVFTNIL